MSFLKAKSEVLQFLSALYPADLENSVAASSEDIG